MVATASAEDCHVTILVTSCLVLSVNRPVAVNCCVVPAAICAFVGVTSIAASRKGRILIVTGVPVGRTSTVVLPRKVGIVELKGKAVTSKALLSPTCTST